MAEGLTVRSGERGEVPLGHDQQQPDGEAEESDSRNDHRKGEETQVDLRRAQESFDDGVTADPVGDRGLGGA